jgi:hypothetical protein
MIGNSKDRVPDQTAEHINKKIAQQTEQNITYYAAHQDEIDQRLDELDQEWDIERALETGASSFMLTGLLFGMTRNRAWYLFSGVIAGFLLQHALQGWCPPLPVFRRLGFRTRHEIDQERFALKAIRGDFKDLPEVDDHSPVSQVFQAMRD